MLPVLVAAWSLGTAHAAPPGEALVIAASAPHTGGERPDAERDARRVQRLLKRTYGYDDVRLLKGDDVTVRGTLEAIGGLTSRIGAGAPAVVYFAGDGALVGDRNRDEPDPWDEALSVADGWLLDDALAPVLAALDAKAGEVTVVLDVALAAGPRFAGRHADAGAAGTPGGDGDAGWPRPGEIVLVEGARTGVARVDAGTGGWFTTQLLVDAPVSGTWRALEQRLLSTVLTGSPQLPDVRTGAPADLGRPVFGVARDVPEPEHGTFAVEPRPVAVTLVTSSLPDAWSSALTRAAKASPWRDWMTLQKRDRDDPGSYSLSMYSFSTASGGRDAGYALKDPAGATRAQLPVKREAPTDDEVFEVLQRIRSFARQAAFLDLHPTSPDLEVQIVSTDEQAGCSHPDRWRQAPPNAEQIVPVCHRWVVEVGLSAGAPRPLEVGGLILANDGYSLGFPSEGQPTVTLSPGERHRFPLASPGQAEGVISTPPLGISEAVVVYGGPPASNIRFYDVDNLGSGTRSMTPVSKGWEQVVLPYRIEGTPSDDASEPPRTRELTLNHFDIRYLLPPNERSYLHQLLVNTQRLATMKDGEDGLPYAQCMPTRELAAKSDKYFHTSKWPNGKCWSKPWDFDADRAELVASPGIDCSSTVWWLFTRSCIGDAREPLPPVPEGTRSTNAFYRQFHTETRRCLLVSNSAERAGYQWTGGLEDPRIMSKHWEACDGGYRPGDLLVTRNKYGSGHTFIVIDPDRFIVFGSHAYDYDRDFDSSRLTDEDREILEEYRQWLSRGDSDTGVEYQFLTNQGGGGEDRLGGFDSGTVTACWRHQEIAKQWKEDPSSRPPPAGWSGSLLDYCDSDRCRR